MKARENLLKRRHAPVGLAHPRRHLVVRVRGHPRRRALEEVQPLDARLDGSAPPASRTRPCRSRDALSGQVVGVVPARGVEGVALEALEAGQRGLNGSLRRPGAITSTRAAIGPCESRAPSAARPPPRSRRAAPSSAARGGDAEAVGAPAQVRRISSRIGYARSQSGFGANENEYRFEGTSHCAPG